MESGVRGCERPPMTTVSLSSWCHLSPAFSCNNPTTQPRNFFSWSLANPYVWGSRFPFLPRKPGTTWSRRICRSWEKGQCFCPGKEFERGVYIVTSSRSVAHSSARRRSDAGSAPPWPVSKHLTQGRDGVWFQLRAQGPVASLGPPASLGRGRGRCVWILSLTCVPTFRLNAGARTPPFSARRKDALCGSWEVTGRPSVPASSARLLTPTSPLSTGLVSVCPQSPWRAQAPQD